MNATTRSLFRSTSYGRQEAPEIEREKTKGSVLPMIPPCGRMGGEKEPNWTTLAENFVLRPNEDFYTHSVDIQMWNW